MKLKITRETFKDDCTLGTMEIDGVYFCKTLEDKCRDDNKNGVFDNGETKVYGETAIPYGSYSVVMYQSPRFGRMLPLIQDISEFTGVLIHRGNYPKDTLGCILVGEYHNGSMVCNSTPYETKIVTLITEAIGRGEKISIEIV